MPAALAPLRLEPLEHLVEGGGQRLDLLVGPADRRPGARARAAPPSASSRSGGAAGPRSAAAAEVDRQRHEEPRDQDDRLGLGDRVADLDRREQQQQRDRSRAPPRWRETPALAGTSRHIFARARCLVTWGLPHPKIGALPHGRTRTPSGTISDNHERRSDAQRRLPSPRFLATPQTGSPATPARSRLRTLWHRDRARPPARPRRGPDVERRSWSCAPSSCRAGAPSSPPPSTRCSIARTAPDRVHASRCPCAAPRCAPARTTCCALARRLRDGAPIDVQGAAHGLATC